MRTPLAFALIAIGIILVIFGVNAYHSFNSDVTRTFSGHPTNEAIWLLVGGAAAGLAGLTMLSLRRNP